MKLSRRSLLALAFLPLLPGTAAAQFEVELALDGATYLKFEPIMAHVKISNFSGHPIGLFNHKEKPWLSFYVSRPNGQQVDDLGVEYDLQQAQIKAGDALTVHVNLTPVYNIRAPGLYRVMAIVHSATHNREFKSNVRQFDLTSGRVIWQETVVVAGTNAVAESTTTDTAKVNDKREPEDLRTYALLAHRVDRGERLYARVESEAKNVVYGVIQLGVFVSLSKPETTIDRNSHLHVLHQVGSRTFSYVELTPDARLANQKAYSNLRSRPELKADDTGFVSVVGGEQTYPNPALLPLPDTQAAPESPSAEGSKE